MNDGQISKCHKKEKHTGNSHRKRSRSSSSSSDNAHKKKRKKDKKSHKHKHKKEKNNLKFNRKHKHKERNDDESKVAVPSNEDFDVPIHLMESSKSLAPMTKEEWEKRQSVIKRVYDESSGRHRLIKGDGEVIEEIVSRKRHLEINEQATKGDGDYFQSMMQLNKR